MGIAVIQNAKPDMKATEVNAFCRPRFSTQLVVAKHTTTVLLRITTATIQSLPTPPAESTAYV